MRAMVFCEPRQPLRFTELSTPKPAAGQLLARVARVRCAARTCISSTVNCQTRSCRWSRTRNRRLRGSTGPGGERFKVGDRIGVPWLGRTCGECGFCRSGRESLCDQARVTGYTLDDGYAEKVSADTRSAFLCKTLTPMLKPRVALCRAHWLSVACTGGHAKETWHLWFWFGGADRGTGGAPPGA
jgi:propanol-preferring alcohol dehydrogenase